MHTSFKNLIFWITATALAASLLSCTSKVERQHEHNVEQFHQTLMQAAYNNKKIAEKSRRTVGVSPLLSAALTPKINIIGSRSRDGQRFNFAVNKADASAFFLSLSKGMSGSIVVSPDVHGKISLNMKNVTIPQVLEVTRQLYGYQYRKTSYGYDVYSPKLETAIFTLNHLNVERAGASATTVQGGSSFPNQGQRGYNSQRQNPSAFFNQTPYNSPYNAQYNSRRRDNDLRRNYNYNVVGSSGSTVKTITENDFWSNIRSTIALIISAPSPTFDDVKLTEVAKTQRNKTRISDNMAYQVGLNFNPKMPSVKVNPQTGVVVVRAYPKPLRQVAKFLATTQNITGRQVLIEAKFLEVQLNRKFRYGIDWNLFGVSSESHKSDEGKSNGYSVIGIENPLVKTDYGNVFKVRASAGNNFSAVLSLLSAQGRVTALSSPRISTMNNVKAVIKVGSASYYVTGISSDIVPATSTTTSYYSNYDIQPFFSGVSLDVTPQINANGWVTLHIHPVISRVHKDKLHIMSGDSKSVIPTAKSEVRESDSIVQAKSGQVIIIGGLMQNYSADTYSGLPFKTKSGLLNKGLDALATQGQGLVRSELVILLRPIVIKPGVWSNELKHTANSQFGDWGCRGPGCATIYQPDAKG